MPCGSCGGGAAASRASGTGESKPAISYVLTLPEGTTTPEGETRLESPSAGEIQQLWKAYGGSVAVVR